MDGSAEAVVLGIKVCTTVCVCVCVCMCVCMCVKGGEEVVVHTHNHTIKS